MEDIIVGSDYSGVGAFDQSLIRLGITYKKAFACDFDYYARLTYILNFGTENDLELALSKEHKMFCSGMEFIILRKSEEKDISEFEKKCNKLNLNGFDLETKKYLFSIAADEFANHFSFYYPFNVYDRQIPEESLDIFMTSPPCQAFSLAGKRLGKSDIKGILFFNSLEFIQENKPKTFIFENVKGLLSDDKTNKKALYGNTFQEWINYLGGKSVNGNPTFFPYEDSVPYHIYFKVLNAKDFGVPQNRERIFIIGIRDDEDNNFGFPMPFPLEKRLKDILQSVVDEKYFLSDKMIDFFSSHSEIQKEKGNGFNFKTKKPEDIANTINARVFKMGMDDNYVCPEIIQLNDPIHSNDRVYSELGRSPTLNTMQGGNRQPFVQVSENPVIVEHRGHIEKEAKLIFNGIVPCLRAESHGHESKIIIENSVLLNKTKYDNYEINESGISNTIIAGGTAPSDKVPLVVCFGRSEEEKKRRREHFKLTGQDSGNFKDKTLVLKDQDYYDTLLANPNFQKESLISVQQRIRRLTPTECFRLMDFNPEMIEKTISSGLISDSQLYKQSGNSIVIGVLSLLIQKLLKK